MTALCECGCGETTRISRADDRRKGWVKGEPRRFVGNHHQAPRQRQRAMSESYIIDSATGCWVWQRLGVNGYGRLTLDGVTQPAHRYTYEALNGPVPEGLELDHLCRNKACVNPFHLEAVPHAENLRRAAKLDWETVREIRASSESHGAAGRRLGIDPSHVSKIRRRQRWWPDPEMAQ